MGNENAYSVAEIVVALVGGWIVSESKIIVPVLIVLSVLMLIDYVTGMASAWKAGTLNSAKGVAGILKKAGYLAVIFCGASFDFIIAYYVNQIGIATTDTMFFGSLIAVWYCVNEILSILENASEFSTVPEWVRKRVEKIRGEIEPEKEGEMNDKGD